MATATRTAKAASPRMSDQAVKAKTSKTWKEWFAILDRAGAKKMTHQEIANYLHTKHSVPPWWTQMVTVTYEQQSGLRDKHQRPDGYQISVSRTINVPITKLYKSMANEKTRNAWLDEEDLVVRKSTPNKSMRVTWSDGKQSLEFNFYPKGDNKSQIVVQHSKISDAKNAAKLKTYWSAALDRLRQSLE
ncbi:MAG TPA: hypothetical protein VJU84_00850 [Pyrinomonadaceae bacterium]|nr:hypothetical protein [Pyrinomonadaceae bacterium]